MISYRVQHAAGRRIDDIYNYTREQWGQDQADRYIRGLFVRFEDIAERRIAWRDIPGDSASKASIAGMSIIMSIGVSCPMVPLVLSPFCTSACIRSSVSERMCRIDP
ncbi:type II toxin-antitoxin system RelE/ParE family toxin [Sphingobium fuliginis]|uniref:type II toxin-antitoxin system RelE/ParE family toxin n=1 Tax=Sphingobium fuliginis (strain ATCC 27551) TaxID=336203 RepID=UPI003137802B